MSVRVVKESHVYGDDHVYVPSKEDFEALQKQIDDCNKAVAKRISKTTCEGKVAGLNGQIQNLQGELKSLKSDLRSELSTGEWKTIFRGDIENAINRLETRYQEINDELDKKMAHLPKIAAIEENIKQILIDHQRNIANTISQSGDACKEKIATEKKSAISAINKMRDDYFTVLTREIKNIEW